MIQSAIGGVIYGGGVAGIAKGLGGWFAGKLLPKNTITADNKYKKDENLIIMDNGKIIKNYKSNLLKKVNFKKENYENFTSDSNKINEFNKDSEKNLSKENIIHIKKNTHNYNEIYDKSKKLVSKTIDTKA